MAKRILVNEGSKIKTISNVTKLVTRLQNGNMCTWVPEDELLLATKTIVKDGTYKAASEAGSPYGYSQVTVNGVGTKIMGELSEKSITKNGTYRASEDKDGPFYGYSKVYVGVSGGGGGGGGGEPSGPITGKDDDDDDAMAEVDDDGNVVITKLPDTIQVVTPPTLTVYEDGQTIDFHGIVVKAYLPDGTEWGTVDNLELSFPEPIAEWDGSEHYEFIARTDSLVSNAGTVLSTNNGERNPVTKKNDGAAACLLSINSSDPADDYGGNWLRTNLIGPTRSSVEGSVPNSPWDYQEFNIDGNLVCVGGCATNENWGGASIMSNPQDFPMVTGVPLFVVNRGSTEAHVRKMMEILSYLPGDGSGIMAVPVQWHRPGDSKSLYDNFEITVRPSDDSGGQDPEPAPTPSPD